MAKLTRKQREALIERQINAAVARERGHGGTMTIGNLHINILLSGAAIAWIKPVASKSRGTWHVAVSWASPSFQCGAITRKGYGGLICQARKSPSGKRAWRVGVWAPKATKGGEAPPAYSDRGNT